MIKRKTMDQIYKITGAFQVADQTLVSPFLNPKDMFSNLPFNSMDGFSISAGEIKPMIRSKIHVHPVVTQVTFVYQGSIVVRMREGDQAPLSEIRLNKGQAIVTRPGSFFQMENTTLRSCHVLYIVSPAYVFLIENGKVIYDDAIILDEDWRDLENVDPHSLYLHSLYESNRMKALSRIAQMKNIFH